MNKAEQIISRFFYLNNRSVRFIAINSAVMVAAMIAIYVAAFYTQTPSVMGLGLILVFYSFMSMGKAVGLAGGGVFVFFNLISILILRDRSAQLPYLIITVFGLFYIFHMSRFMDNIDESENLHKLKSESLDNETNEYREKTAKLKTAIDGKYRTIRNYRMLNGVAQKMTSALERQVIVDIISEAVKQIINKPSVRFSLLIYNEDSGLFVPAVEEKNQDMVIKGAVKIYKKDPFDEWIIANKFTLRLKDINDDLRFKDLKKEFFNFKSLLAIPLIQDKKIIGILKLYSEEVDAFDNDDARLMNYLGDLCTAAVLNSILYQKTKELAIRDGLTGLYLRKYFVERLDEEVRRAKETGSALSFLLIDIDHFKDCNDTHGHQFGDKVLRILGEFLKDNLRDVDIIGRYGGEEFAVILPNTATNGSRFVAERLREAFSRLIIKVNENEGIKLTLSVGGVQFEKTFKLMELINKADKALYYSKENGRNKVTFWEDIAE